MASRSASSSKPKSRSAPKSGAFARPARPAAAARPPRRWRWLAVGLVLGIGATLGTQQLLSHRTAIDLLAGSVDPADPADPPAGSPATAAASAEQTLPRFEFYDLLPRESSAPVVPTVAETGADGRVSRQRTNSGVRPEFLIQAGSFLAAEDAEARRVEILLLDLSAFVHEVRLDDGQRWHRVLVGPFETRRAMERARARLGEARIQTLALKPAP